MANTDAMDTSAFTQRAADADGPAPSMPYALRPASKVGLSAAFACAAAAFLAAVYILFPYVPGPVNEALWWHAVTVFVVLGGLAGLAAMSLVRADQLGAHADVGGRLHTWRLLAITTTAMVLGIYLLFCWLLAKGSPVWYSYSAGPVICVLAILALATCYMAPVGHWWELLYSMGLLLWITAAFAFWFPAIDGFYGAALFVAIIGKWSLGLYRRGLSRPRIEGNPIFWFLGLGRLPKRRSARQHERLYTLMLWLGVAPLLTLIAFRPSLLRFRMPGAGGRRNWVTPLSFLPDTFQPWQENALDIFGYVMLAGTTVIYATPLLTAAALLFWCRKYQALTLEERSNHFTRRENLALVLFGVASYFAIGGYYTGQIFIGPWAIATLGTAATGVILALGSRRRLLLFAILLPIAVAVTLKKLNYIGDFLLPLYVGMPLGY